MAEGWLTDAQKFWCVRFHRDEHSWVQDPQVFVDHGRPMGDGEPALLKSRRYLRREDATLLWKQLVAAGWTKTKPLWGALAEP